MNKDQLIGCHLCRVETNLFRYGHILGHRDNGVKNQQQVFGAA